MKLLQSLPLYQNKQIHLTKTTASSFLFAGDLTKKQQLMIGIAIAIIAGIGLIFLAVASCRKPKTVVPIPSPSLKIPSREFKTSSKESQSKSEEFALPAHSFFLKTAQSLGQRAHVRAGDVYSVEGVVISPKEPEFGLQSVRWMPWEMGQAAVTPVGRDQVVLQGRDKYRMTCKAVDEIEKRFRVEFYFRKSDGKKIDKLTQEDRDAGFPEIATHYEFIYPAVHNITGKYGQPVSEETKASVLKVVNELENTELRDFLQIGGFNFFCGEADVEGNRNIAGWLALCPRPSVSQAEQQKKQLHFGQAQLVPDVLYRHMKDSLDDDYCAITAGPLLKHGMTHFRWLVPDQDSMILEMRQRLREQKRIERKNYKGPDPDTFGQRGAFAYYCGKEPAKSCIVPIVTRKKAMHNLRKSFYWQIQNAGKVLKMRTIIPQGDEDGNCVVCMERPVTAITNCDHASMCGVCVKTVENCPICRTQITKIEMLANLLTTKSSDELPKKLTFSLQRLKTKDPYVKRLLKGENFTSPKYPLPAKIKDRLLPNVNADQIAFVYPVFGKTLDISHPFLPKSGDAARMSPAGKGLMDIGGFACYEKGKLIAVFSMVASPKEEHTVSLEFSKGEASKAQRDLINGEITKLETTGVPVYNASRITHGPLFAFAKYFCFANGAEGEGNSFVYRSHNNNYFSLSCS